MYINKEVKLNILKLSVTVKEIEIGGKKLSEYPQIDLWEQYKCIKQNIAWIMSGLSLI